MPSQWDGYAGFGDSFKEMGSGQNFGLGDLGLSQQDSFKEMDFPGMPVKAGQKQGWAQFLQAFLKRPGMQSQQPGGPTQMGGSSGQQSPMDMQQIMQILQMVMGQQAQ